jgi:hypothetical protein
MKHDPERAAAAYLSNTMTDRARKRFESHMLSCEDCWREVDVGRAGRRVAESGREMAPQSLREDVRATIMATQAPWPVRRYALIGAAAASVVAVAAISFVVTRDDQPATIAAVLAHFRRDSLIGSPTDPMLPEKIGDLRLTSSGAGPMEDRWLTMHVYEDAAGHQVAVYSSDQKFPWARDARWMAKADAWWAEDDGTFMFCSDEPHPALLVGDDEREVMLAARMLGMTEP